MTEFPSLRDRMVDVVLEFNRTPRRVLFEYPFRTDESNALIAAAEDVVDRCLALQSYAEPPPLPPHIVASMRAQAEAAAARGNDVIVSGTDLVALLRSAGA